MILRFAITNFRSVKDRAEIHFASTARQSEPSFRLESDHAPHGVLPALALVGANASGKSVILTALLECVRFVRESFVRFGPGEPLPWTPWAMDTSAAAPDTELELDLEAAGVRYVFGFAYRDTGISREWLYRWEGSRPQRLYERTGQRFEYGSKLRGGKAIIEGATRENALFLSTAAQHNHPLLREVYEVITGAVRRERRIELTGHPLFMAGEPIVQEERRAAVFEALRAADLGVADFEVEEMRRPTLADDAAKIFQPEFLEKLRSQQTRGEPLVMLTLRHAKGSGETFSLPPTHESRGTQILLSRLSDFIGVLEHGQLLVVDELDTSLHAELAASLMRLFLAPETNPKGAQLLFATHESRLVGQLRPDEVVLVDKSKDGVTTLAAASDFRGLRGRDDLERAYQQGRLRGVPVTGDFVGAIARGLRGSVGTEIERTSSEFRRGELAPIGAHSNDEGGLHRPSRSESKSLLESRRRTPIGVLTDPPKAS